MKLPSYSELVKTLKIPNSRLEKWRSAYAVFALMVAAVVSILLVATDMSSHTWLLAGLSVALAAFLFFREIFAPKRISEYAIFSHYINHITRDFLSETDKYSGEEALQNILDALSECFSCMTGKKCYASIKQYDVRSNTVSYFLGDRTYQTKTHPAGIIPVDKYRSIHQILAGIRSRYYMSNDVARDYSNHMYMHPMLENYVPLYFPLSLKYSRFPHNWPLLFRSTIVAPIRQASSLGDRNGYRYFGFLCIDCVSRGVFDERYHPEILAATADIICTLVMRMSQVNAAASIAAAKSNEV